MGKKETMIDKALKWLINIALITAIGVAGVKHSTTGAIVFAAMLVLHLLVSRRKPRKISLTPREKEVDDGKEKK